jgi:acetyl-CoA synthetase
MIGEKTGWEPTQDVVDSTRLVAYIRKHGLADLAALLRRADEDPDWYWDSLLTFFDIRFVKSYDTVRDISRGIEWPRWCVGGTTNIVLNCLDRHRDTPTWAKPAILWDGEDGTTASWTFAELDGEVCRLAVCLLARGVRRGEVVGLYMPMIPQAAAAFLAVVKIGAIVMPLFSGFGPEPIAQRLNDGAASAIIVADIGWRRGKSMPMLATVEQALAQVPSVHTVLVLGRSGNTVKDTGRVVSWPDSNASADASTEILDAEAPAMLMYTSGTTGRPKGTIHTHCGILAKNALDLGLCIDLKPEDRLLWMSDMGWIVGPKLVVSTTLLGATMILVEGTPDWPDETRMWRLAAAHRATMIGVVPTMVRQMMRRGVTALTSHDLSSLRATISIGEPWTTEAWCWFYEHVCQRRIPILNYAGGTECGGAILISSFLQKLRPCAFGHAVPGCGADVVDTDGRSRPPGQIGELVMRHPSIGMTRGLWKAPERYVEEYWRVIPDVWVQGDLASRDNEGLWYLHGRSDDTIKIAGKRTGPAEIESVLLGGGLIADCAVVGVPDDITGSALAVVCVPLSPRDETPAFARQLADMVGAKFGGSYRPRLIVMVSELPKTRNQKIMRRVIRSVLSGQPLGDISSLADPRSIDSLRDAPRFDMRTELTDAVPLPINH